MVLCDSEIKKIGQAAIDPYRDEAVGSVAYDLQCDSFGIENSEVDKVTLAPGDSAFVKSIEGIDVPPNMIVRVLLRNSRIRQGLSLEAPVYQPGHKTRVFYRITNVSGSSITLSHGDGVASIMFEFLSHDVEHPYSGTFQNEIDFRGMGKYGGDYIRQMSDVEEKIEDVKEIEKHIYSNVLSIMAVFVAVFSLININVQNSSLSMKSLISLSLATVGFAGTLITIIHSVTSGKKNSLVVWIVCIAPYALAVLLQYI